MNASYGFVSLNILALAMIALALVVLYGKKDKNATKELMLVFTFIFIGSLFIFLEVSSGIALATVSGTVIF